MKRKSVILLLVLGALLLFGSPAAARDEDSVNCILGFMTRDWNGNSFCQYTLPPGNCVICYAEIVVKG